MPRELGRSSESEEECRIVHKETTGTKERGVTSPAQKTLDCLQDLFRPESLSCVPLEGILW